MPLAAQTAPPAPSAQEIAAATRYVLPSALDGVYTSCAGTLATEGYLLSNRAALTAKFSDGAEAQWPAAKRLIMTIGGGMGQNGGFDDIAALPDEAVKPLRRCAGCPIAGQRDRAEGLRGH